MLCWTSVGFCSTLDFGFWVKDPYYWTHRGNNMPNSSVHPKKKRGMTLCTFTFLFESRSFVHLENPEEGPELILPEAENVSPSNFGG